MESVSTSDTSCEMTSSVSPTRGVESRAVWRAGRCRTHAPHCQYGYNRIACLRHAARAEAWRIIPNKSHSSPLRTKSPPVSKTRHPTYPTLNVVQCGGPTSTTSPPVSKTRQPTYPTPNAVQCGGPTTAKKLVIQNTNALNININLL